MLNAAAFGFTDSLASPYLVLPLFVNALGGSNLLIGLLPAISNGGWYFPQFLISHRLQRMPRKLIVYRNAGFVRAICWAILTLVTWLIADRNPTITLTLFFVLFATYAFSAGFAGSPFMEIVAKTIPADRRGSYFGRRDLIGAVAAIAAGAVANYLLSPTLVAMFPLNFAYLFLITGIAIAIGLIAFSLVTEPVGATPPSAITFREQVRAARFILAENWAYRRYVVTRITLAIADIATPFYAIFAIKVLEIPAESVGLYIWISTLASLTTNVIWSRLSDRRGNRLVLIGAATGMVAMPLIALGFGLLTPSASLAIPFGIMFVIAGITRPAANIAYPSYLLDIAPATERPLYIGLTNTVLGIATFIPVIGGILLDLFGYRAVMLIALAISALAWWLARSMIEPRVGKPKSLGA